MEYISLPVTQLEYYKIGHLYKAWSESGKSIWFAPSSNPDKDYDVRVEHGSLALCIGALCIGSVTNDSNRIYGLFLVTNMQGHSEEFACGDWEKDAMWLKEMTA